MTEYARSAANHTVLSNDSTTGNRRAACQSRVITDPDVVGYLDLIVQPNIVAQDCVFKSASVNGGVSANFAIRANFYTSQLGNFEPAAAFHCQPESIATDYSAGMDQCPLADHHLVENRNGAHQLAGWTNSTASSNQALRTNGDSSADYGVIFNDAQRTDGCGWVYLG